MTITLIETDPDTGLDSIVTLAADAIAPRRRYWDPYELIFWNDDDEAFDSPTEFAFVEDGEQ